MIIRVFLYPVEIEVDEQAWAEYMENDEVGVNEILLEINDKIMEIKKKAIHHTEEIRGELNER